MKDKMADNHSKEIRSKNMSHIRSTNTKPEELVRKHLFSRGFRYRKNVRNLPGCPDIVLPKYHTVIFVNGCFWHRHKNCKYAYVPKSNVDFWLKKFNRNIERDDEVKKQLSNQGIRILVIWECIVKKMMKSEKVESDIMSEIECFLNADTLFKEIE